MSDRFSLRWLRSASSVRSIVLIWLAWLVVLLAFQTFVTRRLQLARPDYALLWTRSETDFGAQRGKPYLNDPFMNGQVSWDSEFYLSIATVGYDDPAVRAILPDVPGAELSNRRDASVLREPLSLNYAFFPLYPYVTRLVAAPLTLLGLTPVATSTLAGVIVSLLGTLAAMLALYDLTRDRLADAGGLRAAFYLVVFPSGFFLAQVYSEGLFVGLAFTSLALIRRNHLLAAGILAALAVWTRAVGVALVLPLALAWSQPARGAGWLTLSRERLAGAVGVLLPLAAYLVWNATLGASFHAVEDGYFARGALLVEQSVQAWSDALKLVGGANPQTAAYYTLEFASMALALVACLFTLPRYPGVALFGLAVLAISFTSGVPQSMIRYVVAVPSIYILLAWFGRSPAFDRSWSLISILLLGLLATLFTFDMWVA
ncbi:MAG: hypothetical protein HZC41_20000 [Chloroflexi bacterium]|nr:hypothetical protein [Chloroflexota bacterium]